MQIIDFEQALHAQGYTTHPRLYERILAQRAYDLAQYVIGYTLEYLHGCGLRMPGSMNLSIQPSIPDLTTFPEVSK